MTPDTITLQSQAMPAAASGFSFAEHPARVWDATETVSDDSETTGPTASVRRAPANPDERTRALRNNEDGRCTGASDGAPSSPGQPPDLKLLENRIAELSARIQAATYELLCYLREFDRHYGWEGFRSCAHWLNWRTGLDLGAAREKMRVAEALADLNLVSAAMACGRLSYSKVRALTRVATPATEARLVALACCATAAHVERLVRAWRQADRAAQPDAEQARLASRALSTRVEEDGMVVLRAWLTPEVGAVVLRALEAALEQVPAAAEDDEELSIGQRRADALGLMAESALAAGLDPAHAGDRYQVTVHVDADALCSREADRAAARVSAETRADNAPASEPAVPAPASASGPDASQGLIEPTVGLESATAVTTEASAAGVDISAETRMDGEAGAAYSAPAPAPAPGLVVALNGSGEASATGAAASAEAGVGRQAVVEPGTLPPHGDAGPATIESAVWLQACTGTHGSRQATPAPGLDAGQAVIEQAGGLHVGAEVARRVACDAGLVVLYHGLDGAVLNVGRKTRTVPTALRRALEGRDRNQCQFPGCNSRNCDAHHVEHWADGGETRLANLVSLCRFHHRAVHESGFRVVATPAGQFLFLRPDGEPLPVVPPMAAWRGTGEPLAPTVARLEDVGITIGPHTATPEWYGETLDVAVALDALWQPPVAAAPGGGP